MVFPAIESHIAIAGTYVRSAEFDTALEYCESACELLNSLPTEQLTANSAIQDAVLVTRSIKDALQLAQTTDLSTPEQIETLTGDTEKWAFALHAYRESLHSNIVIATQLADLLANVQMQNARVHSAMNFTLAATYVMVATKRHDADPEVDNSSVFKKSIDLLSHHLPPQEVFQAVLRDPDFELLRQSDEFKNVVESIETRK